MFEYTKTDYISHNYVIVFVRINGRKVTLLERFYNRGHSLQKFAESITDYKVARYYLVININ